MIFVVVALCLVLVAWIIKPLLAPAAVMTGLEDELERLIEMKHAVYRAIIDLEHDAKVGKVSEEDQELIRRQHEAEAVVIIKQLDAHATEHGLSDQIEREIAAARKRLRPGS